MRSIRTVPRDLAAFGGPAAAVSFVAGVAAGNGLSDAPYPRPGASAETIKRYFSDNVGPARLSIAGQLVSAASLGVFSTSVARLARQADRGSRHPRRAGNGPLSPRETQVLALVAEGMSDDAGSGQCG